MSVDEVLRKLQSRGLILKDKKRNGNETGYQLRFTTGEIVNIFDNGTISPQGKNQEAVREALDMEFALPVTESQSSKLSRKIFVVYGHDGQARTQLEAMLRRWDLDPLRNL